MTSDPFSFQKTGPQVLSVLPRLALRPCGGYVPGEDECRALWDRYDMLDNIRAHSLRVADLATRLAGLALARGQIVDVAQVRAAALLHDIAKTYSIRHSGSHAQIGASWVISETGNRAMAQGVMHHVRWPWELPDNVCRLPFFIIYADKRVMHDRYVSLDERYADLLVRYGHSGDIREGILASHRQGQTIERALSAQLGLQLHEYTIDCGRLVQRA